MYAYSRHPWEFRGSSPQSLTPWLERDNKDPTRPILTPLQLYRPKDVYWCWPLCWISCVLTLPLLRFRRSLTVLTSTLYMYRQRKVKSSINNGQRTLDHYPSLWSLKVKGLNHYVNGKIPCRRGDQKLTTPGPLSLPTVCKGILTGKRSVTTSYKGTTRPHFRGSVVTRRSDAPRFRPTLLHFCRF